MSYVILNPANDLLWSAVRERGPGYRPRNGSFVSERSGQYSTYATRAHAEGALRRTQALRSRGCVVVPEPAHERALRIEELRQQERLA